MIRVIFFGTPDFAVPSLSALLTMPGVHVGAVVTQPDRPAGRGGKLQQSPVKILATKNCIPVLQPERLGKSLKDFITALTPLGPFHIGVVVAYGQILPLEALQIPRVGCVNVHASLLPRWRGAAPIQRAILAGDSETGVCLMQMDVGLDTGPVYAREKTSIAPTDNAGTLHDRLAQLGGAMLTKYLDQIAHQKITPTPQPEAGVTYASKVESTDSVLDWKLSAAENSRIVRAFSPFPGAATTFNGKRLKILIAEPRPAHKSAEKLAPGTVTFADKRTLEVACGDGVLSLKALQLEGKKRLPVEEFLRGHQLKTGLIIGA